MIVTPRAKGFICTTAHPVGCRENILSQIACAKKHLQETAQKIDTDTQGRIRMDDWELKTEVQKKVMQIWDAVTTENVKKLCDLDGYWEDFYKIFGFGIKNVDYSRDVEV